MFSVLSDALTNATATALSSTLSAHTTNPTARRPRPQTPTSSPQPQVTFGARNRRAVQHLDKIYAYVFSVWIPCPNCGGHGKTRFNVAGQTFANDFDHLVVQMV